MVDVNIIAEGNTSKLIALECERLGLNCKISKAPITDAGLYICDVNLANADALPQDKTVIIGAQNERGFENSLGIPFLLTDLRQMLIKALSGNTPHKAEASKKQKRTTAFLLSEKEEKVKIRGKEISLSPTEFKIFNLLFSRKGEVVTYDEINSLIGTANSNKANVYVCFLRKKLEAHGDKIIYSVRSKGFMIK